MKTNVSIFFILFILLACHSSDGIFLHGDVSLTNASAELNEDALTENRWQMYFFCHGNDYWLNTRFVVKKRDVLVEFGESINASADILGEVLPAAEAFSRYQGSFDPLSGIIRLFPVERKKLLPEFIGVYEPGKRQIAFILGGDDGWQACSSAIAVLEPQMGEIADGMLGPESTLSALIEQSLPVRVVDDAVNDVIGELLPEHPIRECDEGMLDWANGYLQSGPDKTFSALSRAQILDRYQDDVFRAAFDSTLSEMSIADGVLRARLLLLPRTCNLGLELGTSRWESVERLTYPLANHVSYGRNAVVADKLALDVTKQWLQLTYVRMRGWFRSPGVKTAARLQALDWIENVLPLLEIKMWPTELAQFRYQIAETRQSLEGEYY